MVLVGICLVALSPSAAVAQSYLVHTFTADAGLPSSTIFGLAQDRRGRLWAATRAGVAVYDGVSWQLEPPSLPGVVAISGDGCGDVWVAAHGSSDLLHHYDGQTWTNVPQPADWARRPQQITAFAATGGCGRQRVAVGTATDGLYLWNGTGYDHLVAAGGLPSDQVRGLAWWGERLVVATSAGLCSVSGTVDGSLNLLLPAAARKVVALALSTARPGGSPTLYLLSSTEVGMISNGAYSTLAPAPPFASPRTWGRVMLHDGGLSLYLGDTFRLFRLDLGDRRLEPLGRDNGLVADGANALLLDHEHSLWVGGNRGISTVVSRRFATYRQAHGLLTDEVTAICEPSPGVLVFGHPIGLTVTRNRQVVRTVEFGELAGQEVGFRRVLDLASDANGVTWVAAADLGLGRLSPDGALTFFGNDSGLTLPVTAVLALRNGELWVAARGRVWRRAGQRFEVLPWSLAASLYVRAWTEAANGDVLMATSGVGLARLSGSTLAVAAHAERTGVTSTYAVLEDSSGRVWVGSQAGLLRLDRGRLAPADEPQIGSPVYFVVEGAAGELWFGTDDGVVRWDGARTTRYTPREGLAGRETNRAAGFLDSAGDLWIGTDGGVSVYQRRYDGEVPAPRLELVAVEAGSELLDPTAPHELPHHRNAVTFHYQAISFVDEVGLRYRYRLEGSDSDWSPAVGSHQRSARYTHLPPGRYRFHVQAANAAGGWSSTVSTGLITIGRPPWRSWWFAALGLAGTALLAFLVAAVLERRRAASRLETLVERRTRELAESEARYRRLFADVATPKLLLDPEGTVVEANRSACTLCQRRPEELIGRRVAELGLGWLDDVLGRYGSHACDRSDAIAATSDSSGGQRRDLEAFLHPFRVQGRDLLLITVQDTTARRQLQEERLRASKLDSLGLLAGGIAHDFNNILTAALGSISLERLRSRRGEPPGEFLDTAERALLRAKELTAQLLAFAKGGEPVRRMSDLRELLEEAARFALAGANASLELAIAEELWPAEVDQGQLAQAMHNLVLNAAQAMPGGGTVRVEAANVEVGPDEERAVAPGPHVRITIVDHGVGIPAENLQRIFDPYFTTKAKGSGLGLASTYAIVTRHQGWIGCDSEVGRGTTFTLHLPAAPGGRTPGQRAASRDRGAASGSRGRVLVLEDEEDLQRMYSVLLEELGFEPVVTGDGERAIAAYLAAKREGRPFVAAVMDLTIRGGMGGREAIARLRELDPTVRAIVASGYSNDPVLANFRQAGFRGVLPKPFTLAQLGEALDELLADAEPPARA